MAKQKTDNKDICILSWQAFAEGSAGLYINCLIIPYFFWFTLFNKSYVLPRFPSPSIYLSLFYITRWKLTLHYFKRFLKRLMYTVYTFARILSQLLVVCNEVSKRTIKNIKLRMSDLLVTFYHHSARKSYLP